jgi:tRNA threonylcarbamoyl adenosine modification protein YeaZ
VNILTIDTALNKTYLTFNGATKTIETDETNYHSAYLVSGIKDLLSGAQPDVIGVNIGPGSFTGIRVGLTVTRVMGQQLECKLVGVPSCEILSTANGGSAVIMDARRGAYYFYNGEKTELISKDDLPSPQKVICDQSSLKMLQDKDFDAISFEGANLPLGEHLAELTAAKLHSGDDFHWSKLKPLYIQTPPIFGGAKSP